MAHLRVVFMGTPQFAVPTLSELLGAGHEVAAVYTQPARAAGRGMGARASPVQDFAEAAGLPVLTPQRLQGREAAARFAGHGADIAVVVAYGLILPRAILEAPGHGCLNLHASLLPRWRGAAPINRALMAGDAETGVTIMRMAEGLDTGPICTAEQVVIGPNTTAGELHDRLAGLGADLTVRALAALQRGTLDCVPQAEEGVTYARKIDKTETRIDWAKSAISVHNSIRGLSPYPGAWFEYVSGGCRARVKVLRCTLGDGSGPPGTVLDDTMTIACGEGAVRLIEVQRAGKALTDALAFQRGARLAPGSIVA